MLGRLLSYIRYPFSLVLAALATAIYAVWIVLLGLVFGADQPGVQQVFIRWGKLLLWLFNIRVEVEGLENIPQRGVIFLFNHASDFDIPIICSILPVVSRFGAKIELFKVPFLALGMRGTGTLPIARGNREEVLRVYDMSIPRVKNGVSFVLAPEGTRQTEPAIGPFKHGPFIFAIKAGAPVVPIVLEGALDIMPKKSVLVMWGIWSKTVRVRILKPIESTPFTQETLLGLQDLARQEMVQNYQKLRELSTAQR